MLQRGCSTSHPGRLSRRRRSPCCRPGQKHLPPPRPGRRGGVAKPLARIEAANRSAVREPVRDFYVGAVQVYPWSEGALYRLYTAPGQVSDIALQPGESLVSVAAGDTVRWIIGDTASGRGDAPDPYPRQAVGSGAQH